MTDPLINGQQPAKRPGNTCGLFVRYTPGPGNVLARWDDRISPEVHWDQYYTARNVAQALYTAFLQRFGSIHHLMVEPSAGTGAFFEIMPAGSLGFDVDPKCVGVWCADFLTVDITCELPIAVIGNPPFGRSASMAVEFFNRAARMANVIAFILPRSVRKAAIENRLNRNFHLVHDEVVPDGAFVFRSQPYTVSTVFQIWERQRAERIITPVETTHPDFKFCTRKDADFAIQRVGARAGRVHHEFDRSEKAHYFVKGAVEHIMRQLDFDSVVHNTAGKPSLAKSEIVALYRSFVEPRGQQA